MTEKAIVAPDGKIFCPECGARLEATVTASVDGHNLHLEDGKLKVDVSISESTPIQIGLLYCMYCDYAISNVEFYRQCK